MKKREYYYAISNFRDTIITIATKISNIRNYLTQLTKKENYKALLFIKKQFLTILLGSGLQTHTEIKLVKSYRLQIRSKRST